MNGNNNIHDNNNYSFNSINNSINKIVIIYRRYTLASTVVSFRTPAKHVVTSLRMHPPLGYNFLFLYYYFFFLKLFVLLDILRAIQNNVNVQRHKKTHRNKGQACTQCPETFKRKTAFKVLFVFFGRPIDECSKIRASCRLSRSRFTHSFLANKSRSSEAEAQTQVNSSCCCWLPLIYILIVMIYLIS